MSPGLAIIDTTLRSFQYKLLNVLFVNKELWTFGITNTTLCSFCNTLEETPIHIFDYIHVKCLRLRLKKKFQNDFIQPPLTPQTVILGLYNEPNDNYKLLSHILLILKYYICISRKKRTLNTDILIANLIKVKKGRSKWILLPAIKEKHTKKSCVTDNILPVT